MVSEVGSVKELSAPIYMKPPIFKVNFNAMPGGKMQSTVTSKGCLL